MTHYCGFNPCAGSSVEQCWVVGSQATLLHTTDGGTTWQQRLQSTLPLQVLGSSSHSSPAHG